MLRKVIVLPLWIVLSLGATSCGDGIPATAAPPVIGPEAFVDAMVELRGASTLHSSGYLPEGEPERILTEQGLNAEDLRVFVEVHGRDAALMADLWEQIEQRVAEAKALSGR
jgi:hypothetical protein